MSSRLITPAAVCSVLIVVAMSGCGGSGSSTPSTLPPSKTTVELASWQLDPPASVAPEIVKLYEEKDVGAELFQHYCAACHGPEGKGDGIYYSDSLAAKPTDLTDKSIADAWTDDHIEKVIRDGSVAVGKSALCPPWARVFSDEQVAAVVEHIHQLPSGSSPP